MAVDLLWHGFSSCPPFVPGNWLRQLTDQALNLMDHIGAEKAFVEAESAPGWVPLDLALHHSDRVAGIVLNNIWGVRFAPGSVTEHTGSSQKFLETSLKALREPSFEAIRERMRPLFPAGGLTDEVVTVRQALWSREPTRTALAEFYRRLFDPKTEDYKFSEDDIARITVPTLVLWSEGNALHGVDAGERLHRLIKGSDFHVMKRVGQWSQWESPEEHDDIVSRFVMKVLKTSGPSAADADPPL
jgi:pimeloyl-ACP methyl ester carboxylesterase